MNIGERFYCSRCLREVEDEELPCPYCGYESEGRTDPKMLEEGTLLNNLRYQVGAVIGAGGFGITYAAWDLVLDQPAAVKEYYPAGICGRDTKHDDSIITSPGSEALYMLGLMRFIREARTLAALRYINNVVPVIDYFEGNNTAYIVMKYIHGVTLGRYVKDNNIPPQEVIAMMRGIVDALGLVHSQGVIHRDISPNNIMVEDDGSITLIDFGAASLEERRLQGMDRTGIYNRKYAAPEQYGGAEAQQGAWTDVYELSATIYSLICGEAPSDSIAENGSVLTPSSRGIRLRKYQERAIMQGLSWSVGKRIKSMEVFRSVMYNLPMPEEVKRRRKFMLRVVSAASLAASVSILVAVNLSYGFFLGGGIRYSLSNDGLHVRGFSDGMKNITIPSALMGIPVTGISTGAFLGGGEIQALNVPDTLKDAEPDAFAGAGSRLVILGSSGGAFSGTARELGLNYAHIETSENETGITVTSYETEQDSARIPDYIDGKPVTAISSGSDLPVFPPNVKRVVLPSGLKSVGDFAFCGVRLESIELPDGLEAIGRMSFASTFIEGVEIPDSVKTLGYGAFSVCSQLRKVKLPRNITVIPEGCFDEDAFIEAVEIPAGVREIRAMAFHQCMSLSSLRLPDGLVRIGSGAFMECSSLRTVYIPPSVEHLSASAFDGCPSYLTVTGWKGTNAEALCDRFGFRFYDMAGNEDGIMITPEGELIVLPGIPGKAEIFLPSYSMDVAAVKTASAVHLKSRNVTMPERLGTVGAASFNANQYIESADFPASLRNIEMYAFAECLNLKHTALKEGLEIIDGAAFYGCTGLEVVNIPSTVRQLGIGAFQRCSNLREANIPSSLVVLEADVFSWTGLKSIVIPGNVVKCLTAFYGCHDLKEAEILSGTRILWGTFAECDSLETVIIPPTMLQVSRSTFKGCRNLRDVWIYSDTVELDYYGVLSRNIEHGDCKGFNEPPEFSCIEDDGTPQLFTDCPGVTLHARKNSTAHNYAIKHGLKFEEIR